MKAAARAAGHDIIDLGMGNPDGPTPQPIVDKLIEAIRNPRTHRYSTSRGIPGLRRAHAAYYAAPLRRARSTPRARSWSRSAPRRASPTSPRRSPRPATSSWCPTRATRSIPTASSSRAPRSATCRSRRPAISWPSSRARPSTRCRRRPRSCSTSPPTRPRRWSTSTSTARWSPSRVGTRSSSSPTSPTPRSTSRAAAALDPARSPGAKEVAVEFTSLSKTYSMPGWRIGFAAGNPALIGALARIKSYLDYGAFTPIQVAATAALNGDAGLHRGEPRPAIASGATCWSRACGRRLADAGAAGDDVRLGAAARGLPRRSARSPSASCCSRRPRSRCRRGSASASMARATSASRWSRTASGSARRCATSGPSSGARRQPSRPRSRRREPRAVA